jgi:hypothetical protein
MHLLPMHMVTGAFSLGRSMIGQTSFAASRSYRHISKRSGHEVDAGVVVRSDYEQVTASGERKAEADTAYRYMLQKFQHWVSPDVTPQRGLMAGAANRLGVAVSLRPQQRQHLASDAGRAVAKLLPVIGKDGYDSVFA